MAATTAGKVVNTMAHEKIRTLVRAEYEQAAGYREYFFLIPAWDYSIRISVHNRDDVPREVYNAIAGGQIYFHARVNLDAEQFWNIRFSDWELS